MAVLSYKSQYVVDIFRKIDRERHHLMVKELPWDFVCVEVSVTDDGTRVVKTWVDAKYLAIVQFLAVDADVEEATLLFF